MNRKPILLALLVLLLLSLVLGGCKRSAAPELDVETVTPEAAPTDEMSETIREAQENTEALEETPSPEAGEGEPTEAATEPSVETTPEETVTPEETPVETTPEPTTEAAPEEPAMTTGPATHVVQPGENLFRISLRYGVSVDAIAQANGITNAALIYVGQVLKIPDGAAPAPSPPPSGERTHIVQPGENLFRIALRYNYDQYYIARYNGIDNPALIYPGQVIRIP